MRQKTVLTVAAAGGIAIALTAVTPALAADTTWSQEGDSWWSTAAWTSTVPAAGDNVTFAGGPRSTYNLGDLGFGSFHFTNAHTIANGGGAIALDAGLTADAGALVTIEPGLTTSSTQTWSVGAGAVLTLPSQVNVNPASTLTLAVDGLLEVTTGNLDGGASACIVKSGSGILRLASGGGGVGACPGQPEGLLAEAGEVEIVAGAALGGKSLAAVGGTVTGGALGAPGVVRQLNLGAGGTVSPGASSGSELGQLDLWGTSTWSGGTYLVDWDPATGASDLVFGDNQAISLTGAVLAPRILGGAAPTTTPFTVLSSSTLIDGAFLAPDGSSLTDGIEFVSGGQVYRYGEVLAQDGSTVTAVTLTWVRAVPPTPDPDPEPQPGPQPDTTPTPPVLADTGSEASLAPLAISALLMGAAGAILILRRRPKGH